MTKSMFFCHSCGMHLNQMLRLVNVAGVHGLLGDRFHSETNRVTQSSPSRKYGQGNAISNLYRANKMPNLI